MKAAGSLAGRSAGIEPRPFRNLSVFKFLEDEALLSLLVNWNSPFMELSECSE